MSEPTPFAVNPEEAIAYLRDKLNVPTAAWTDIWQEMHARAFVVAGAQSEALLADFREAVDKAIAQGTTLAEFRKDFDRIVAAHGWSYNGSRGWRSAVIFNTNLRMAYAAGRWQRITRNKRVFPYLRYIAVMDARTRPLHRAWHNTVLPVDHEWWQTHFPPNGWNCRCSVQALMESDLKRLGLQVSPEPPASPLVPKVISGGGQKTTVMVPKGIDPGFAYNPGVAGFGRGQEMLALEKHGQWLPLESPLPPAAPSSPLKPVDESEHLGPSAPPGDPAALRVFLRVALGGDEKIVTDPMGGAVLLSQAIVDHMLASPARQIGQEQLFPLLPGLISDPQEIWIGWARNDASGRVALRRRYVKLVRIDKTRAIGIVADADGSMWSGMTFFRGTVTALKGLREGLRIFRAP